MNGEEKKYNHLAGSFIDNKKEVPFIGGFEDNPRIAKLAPSFKKLEELFQEIKEVKARLKD